MSNQQVSRIHGIIPAIPTPFLGDEKIDFPALRRIVRYVIDGGVHALWVLGSGAEFTCLDEEQKTGIISAVVEEARGRIPVIAGTGQAGTELAVRTARIAAQSGADVLFAIPPYYYFYTDQEIEAHFRTVAEATPLPLILYHNPFNTKITVPLDTVRRLCAHEKIIGIKDSSLNFDHFQALLRAVPRDGTFKVLQGDELSLTAALLLGADGAVLAAPTLAPRLCVNLYNAARSGDLDRARTLQDQIADLFSVFAMPGHAGDSAFLGGQKAALELMGLCRRSVSRPFLAFEDHELEGIRKILQRHSLLVPTVQGVG